jgi:hypothetical protein
MILLTLASKQIWPQVLGFLGMSPRPDRVVLLHTNEEFESTGPASLDQLRAAATDTVNGADWVFGYARGRDRLASALKFKIVRLEGRLRLLAFAREQRVLDEARRALAGHRSRPETWRAL